MIIERKPTRYAHTNGHTDVCYSEDGQRLITCGTDGDIRIWSGFDDVDPVQNCFCDWSLCVRQRGNRLYIAADDNSVLSILYPEGERDGILKKFTAPVTHVALGKDHQYMALVAEDMEVNIINLSIPRDSNNILRFSGLTGPPLSVALCPKARFLAVSCGDGMLRIWSVENTSLVKEFNCVPKTNSFINATLLCRMDFEPISGNSLAYPDKNTVIIVNTSDWCELFTLSDSKIESDFSIVQFSPCGNFLAAASNRGELVVWKVTTNELVDIIQHPQNITLCAMMWNPCGNGEIAFCDVQGQLGIALNCNTNPISENACNEEITNDVDFNDIQSESDENENAISLEKLKNDIMGISRQETSDKASSRSTTPRPRTPETLMQEAFMPSSTPKHLSSRYLCWNEIGLVCSYGFSDDGDDDLGSNKSIEVEFHDTTFHNSMMLKNFQNYTISSLSTAALVVANLNQLKVIPLDIGSKEWSVNLSEDEEIICVASSNRIVCFATSNYLIHIYGVYGTQKAAISIPGPVVCISAHKYLLLIAYHESAPREGDQCIKMILVQTEGMSIESKYMTSALRPQTEVRWLGFTDVGTPAMFDSFGMLYIYPLKCNIWLPFCDTTKYRKNPSDGFFVTSVYESQQSIRGIRCKGSMYPTFTPRPILSELEVKPIFNEMTTEITLLEASLFTWSTLCVENVEKKFKESALKAFGLACRNDFDQRALELMEMMANPQLIHLATQYALKLNRGRLAERLSKLEFSKEETDMDVIVDQNSTTIRSTTNSRPPNEKLTSKSNIKRTSKNVKYYEEPESSSNITASKLETSANISINSVNDTSSILTQKSLFSQPSFKNPFLKKLKKPDIEDNPLSLTDANDSCIVKEIPVDNQNHFSKEKLDKNNEKRKKPDSSSNDKQAANKQRKLDRFMFTKH